MKERAPVQNLFVGTPSHS